MPHTIPTYTTNPAERINMSNKYGKAANSQDAEATAKSFTKMFITQFVHTVLTVSKDSEFFGGKGGENFAYFLSESIADKMVGTTGFTKKLISDLKKSIEKHPSYKGNTEKKAGVSLNA